jgi:hypothetical protein
MYVNDVQCEILAHKCRGASKSAAACRQVSVKVAAVLSVNLSFGIQRTKNDLVCTYYNRRVTGRKSVKK